MTEPLLTAPNTANMPLLRLLQIADTAFPSGGFAYSHGIEWLAAHASLDEAAIASIIAVYVSEAGGGQWLPAARLAYDALSRPRLLQVDLRLDASIAAEGERNAGRAMGERLLVGAVEAFGGSETAALLDAVRSGRTPGQYPVAFATAARDAHIPCESMLAALGASMAASLAQAAVRLGLVGQFAALRLVAGAAPCIDAAVAASARLRSLRFGAMTPGLDVAAILHPTLPFRMFAS